jgi:hypothetical protein
MKLIIAFVAIGAFVGVSCQDPNIFRRYNRLGGSDAPEDAPIPPLEQSADGINIYRRYNRL